MHADSCFYSGHIDVIWNVEIVIYFFQEIWSETVKIQFTVRNPVENRVIRKKIKKASDVARALYIISQISYWIKWTLF